MRNRKILIIGAYWRFSEVCMDSMIIENTLSTEPLVYRLKARPNLEDYKPIISQLKQLPQKIKYRKKRPFHN